MMNVWCNIIGGSDQLERKGNFFKDSEENNTEVRVCRITWRAPGAPDGLVRNPKKMFGKGEAKTWKVI